MSRTHTIEISSVPCPYEEIKINLNQQQPSLGATTENEMAAVLPEDKHPHIYVIAGAAAGIMEHCVMYPVDSVKTRMQSLQPHPQAKYTSIHQAFTKMINTEGFLRPIRGINIVALGAGPSHALYFGSYEMTKKILGDKGSASQPAIVNAAAGVVATLFHDGTMNPVEVVKQRVQMYGSPYRGVYDCARTVYKTEGLRAFYRSFTTQLTMNIPFQCVHFVTYEFMREFLNPDGGYNARAHLLAGAAAGGLAAALTTPLDVAKTLLNTQECAVSTSGTSTDGKASTRTFTRGMLNALKTIYSLQGFSGYFRGLRARVIYQTPSCAISWSVYEFFKHYLSLTISDEELMELTV